VDLKEMMELQGKFIVMAALAVVVAVLVVLEICPTALVEMEFRYLLFSVILEMMQQIYFMEHLVQHQVEDTLEEVVVVDITPTTLVLQTTPGVERVDMEEVDVVEII
tara:strand:+ start:1574 stop:1894 length:321 start_codon:yes stop_codon:yes gene_type:complete